MSTEDQEMSTAEIAELEKALTAEDWETSAWYSFTCPLTEREAVALSAVYGGSSSFRSVHDGAGRVVGCRLHPHQWEQFQDLRLSLACEDAAAGKWEDDGL